VTTGSSKTAPANQALSKARSAKQDEFYTQLSDIENELKHYRAHFKGKVVLCNCDDPYESNFFRYFALNFNALGLKKLISTSYAGSNVTGGLLPLMEMEGLKPEGKEPYAIEINEVPDANNDGAIDLGDVKWLLSNDANTSRTLTGDGTYGAGDFRSTECVEYLKEADVVVTNPPFSLFREYVAQLVDFDKKFLTIGSQSAITYRDIFSLIRANHMWLGVTNGGTKWFRVPDDYDIQTESRKKIVDGVKYFSMGSIMWFTNLDNPRRHEKLPVFRNFDKAVYPRYDNYDAIEVGRTADIPTDFNGVMGVPITFLDKYNPQQFEIVGLAAGNIRGLAGIPSKTGKDGPYIDGKLKYGRILIKQRLSGEN
jgi:hypothetical protein